MDKGNNYYSKRFSGGSSGGSGGSGGPGGPGGPGGGYVKYMVNYQTNIAIIVIIGLGGISILFAIMVKLKIAACQVVDAVGKLLNYQLLQFEQ